MNLKKSLAEQEYQDIGQKGPNHRSHKDDEEMGSIHDNFSIIHEKRAHS